MYERYFQIAYLLLLSISSFAAYLEDVRLALIMLNMINFTYFIAWRPRRTNDIWESCVSGVGFLASTAFVIASNASSYSTKNDCSLSPVNSVTVNGNTVFWRGESQGSCSTSAELDIIGGALEKWLRDENDGEICAFQCVKGTHGGAYNGYWSFGTDYNFVKNTVCGTGTMTFESCDSGGNGDPNIYKRGTVDGLF
ncbi:Piso0_000046 [Millerozyma farinosa CBS 7064]|uniref:Piso0_000046 protein n=1 Tax=Pichia sorbitophila (strain ATCC MYA-4447 / BCRC 22081 / CBS 7064 / NBRC 10061 / NRRL Y-12695) TaxID=559304 RepID=G8YSY4_PICSO|nr:Piso0_000046 [Millerozyma farinosa CBS 7064]